MTASIRIRDDAAFLTLAQRALLEQELRSELARVVRRLGARREHPAGTDDVPHDADDVQAVTRLQLVPDDEVRRDALEAALARVADGSYGRCVACDATIPFGRLLVMPEVTTCLGCRGRA